MEHIEIDKAVYGVIVDHAEPFKDTPNTVLRRLLGLDGDGTALPVPLPKGGSPTPGRASPGSILPESEYELPILQELAARGGSAHATEIIDAVGARLEDRLTKLDREVINSGDVRWRNRVQFTRLTLKKRGLIAADSPRGIWTLTDHGRTAAQAR